MRIQIRPSNLILPQRTGDNGETFQSRVAHRLERFPAQKDAENRLQPAGFRWVTSPFYPSAIRARMPLMSNGLTITDVAKMANVSVATISRVLSGKPGVSQAKRQEIHSLLERVGYRPNRIAQTLALGRSGLLGVVVSNLRIPFYAQIISVLERHCSLRGYRLLVMDSAHDVEREKLNIDVLREHRAEGFFVIPVHDYDNRVDSDHFLKLKLEKFPFLLIGKIQGLDLDWITFEERETAYRLTRKLMEEGRRRFCFMGFDPTNRTVLERLEGIRRALSDGGLELPPDSILDEVGTWSEGGIRAWEPIIRNHFSRPEPPDALIAANDTLALIAIRNLRKMGLRVPQQVAVAGFDDSDFASLVEPSITTNAKDIEQIGAEAAKMLLARIDDPKAPTRQVEIPQHLCIRESTDSDLGPVSA